MTERQRPHVVDAEWVSWHGDLNHEIEITCPYPPGDHDKPCRLWANEEGTEIEDGCWVLQEHDAIGPDMTFNVPDWSRPPWRMMVHGAGYDGPQLTEVSLSDIRIRRWWHRRRT